MSEEFNQTPGAAGGSPEPQPSGQPTMPVQPQSPTQPTANPYAQPQQPVYTGQQPNSYGQPAPAYYQQPTGSNGKAIGALVCGILAILTSGSVLFGIVLGIVAIVLASKAVKESGKDGKATGGKVCGIAGIVLSVLALIMYSLIFFGAMAYVVAESGNSSGSTYSLSSSLTSENEKAMEAAASAELDKLKNIDPAIVQTIASKLDKGMKDSTDYSLTELGVDPAEFAKWMLTDFSYELDGAYENADGTGTVYADLELRDAFAFANQFMDDAQALVDSGAMAGMDESAAKAKLGEIYKAAMAKSTGMTDSYVSIELKKTGDKWEVDQTAWASELESVFGLY